jgi:3-phosphoshikimate 1-carboxyvinyltransferase
MIDEFPIFAVAATHANGRTVVEDATELRYKESDRIHDLCVELQRLGADLVETADGFVINGGKMLGGGRVNPHRDHRLAMALLVAGMAANGPVEVEQAEIITESFPQFVHILRSLGAAIHEK